MVQCAKVKAHVAQRDIDQADADMKPRYLANKAVDLVARKEAVEGWGFLRFVDQTKQEKNEAVKGVLDYIAGLAAASVKLAADTTPYEARRQAPKPPKPARQEHIARVTTEGGRTSRGACAVGKPLWGRVPTRS